MTIFQLGLAAGVVQQELELGYPEWLVYLATLLIIFLAYRLRDARGGNKKPEAYLHSTQGDEESSQDKSTS